MISFRILGVLPFRWVRLSLLLFLLGGCTLYLWAALFPSAQEKWGAFLPRFLGDILGRMGCQVEEVYVKGRVRTPLEDVHRLMGTHRGQSLLHCDLSVMQQNLEKLPWVLKAKVYRHWPQEIYVELVEREAVAWWQHNKNHYLIDKSGFVITKLEVLSLKKEQEFLAKLPIVIGEEANTHVASFLEVLEKFPRIRGKTKALIFIGKRRWDLRLEKDRVESEKKELLPLEGAPEEKPLAKTGAKLEGRQDTQGEGAKTASQEFSTQESPLQEVEVKLPEFHPEEALKVLDQLLEKKQVVLEEVVKVDLRVIEKIYLTLTQGPSAKAKFRLGLTGKGKEA